MRKIFLLALALGPYAAAFGQTPPVNIGPLSAPPMGCQNGTGTAVVSVTTSATGVCAAASGGRRSWWRIVNTGGSALYCTDDGTTPTSTYWNFSVAAGGWTVSGDGNVSPLALNCIAPAGTTTITASAVQSGAP